MKKFIFLLMTVGLIAFIAKVGESAEDESLGLYFDFD